MSNFSSPFQEFINILTHLNKNIQTLREHETKMNNYQLLINGIEDQRKRIKTQETYYDKLFESYSYTKIIKNEITTTQQSLLQFQTKLSDYYVECEAKLEKLGNTLNSLLNDIKSEEQQLKHSEYSSYHELRGYSLYVIETNQELKRREYEEMVKKQKEKERIEEQKRIEKIKEREENKRLEEQRRIEQMKQDEERQRIQQQKVEENRKIYAELRNKYGKIIDHLNENEIINLQQEMNKTVSDVIFDSTWKEWSIKNSVFYELILNKSHFIIVIETTEGIKFGCYINEKITQKGKYFNDPKAFIFKFENGNVIKYPIKDPKNAIKIGFQKEDDLFVVGKNDIVIKKKEKKNKSICQQSSYNYNKKENALIGKKGYFDVLKVVVISCNITENEQREIEEKLNGGKKSFTKDHLRIGIRKGKINNDTQHHQIQQTSQNDIFNMNDEQISEIQIWTGLTCGNVLLNFTKNDWPEEIDEILPHLIGKKQLLFVIEDENCDEKFGYYLNTTITEKSNQSLQETDKQSFHFNIQSKRLRYPVKFEIKETYWGGIVFGNSIYSLVQLGDIHLMKDSLREHSYCEKQQTNDAFDYHSISDALCGKTDHENEKWGFEGNFFAPKRLTIIQMQSSDVNQSIQPRQSIKAPKKQLTPFDEQFEKWTSLHCEKIIFDSEKDTWKQNSSIFNKRIFGRKQLIFLIEDDRGEKFGYYLNTLMTGKYGQPIKTDENHSISMLNHLEDYQQVLFSE